MSKDTNTITLKASVTLRTFPGITKAEKEWKLDRKAWEAMGEDEKANAILDLFLDQIDWEETE